MMKKANYGEVSTPLEGKDVMNSQLLKPGAREPSSHQTGSNDQKRQVKKGGPFGKLGGRSFGG